MMSRFKQFLASVVIGVYLSCTSVAFGAEIEVDQIEIEGVTLFNQTEVESTLEIFAGERLEKQRVIQTARNLQNLYQSRGYLSVRVRSDLLRRNSPKGKLESILKFTVFEGLPTRIVKIELNPLDLKTRFLKGDWRVLERRIYQKIDFEKGEILDQDRLADIKKIIAETLVEEEFISSIVKKVEVNPITVVDEELKKKYPNTGGWGSVQINVNIGDRIKFGFRGNREFSKSELQEIITEKQLVGFSENYIEEIRNSIVEKYKEAGFAKVEVEVFTFEKSRYQERIVSFRIEEQNRIEIQKVQFDGNFVFKNDQLKKVFYERAIPIVQQGYFVESSIEKASEGLIEWIRSKGYLSAKLIAVSNHFIKNESRSVSTIYLYEGDQTMINEIKFEGITALKHDEVMQILGIKADRPLDPFAFSEGIERLKQRYHSMGYLDVRILNEDDESVIQYYQKNRIADISVKVDEGSLIRVSQIFVEGIKKTEEHIVTRELEFKEGDLLTSEGIRESELSLRRLGIFSSISIQARNDALKKGHKQVRVTVQEGTPGRIGGGVGIRNDLGLRVFTEFAYTNLWGRNHTWSIDANANRRFEDFCKARTDASVCFVEYEARMGYRWPWFLISRLTFRPEISFERRRYFQFDAIGGALRMSWERQLFRNLNLVAGLTYSLERTKQENAVFEEDNQTLTIGAITPSLQLDLRDNPLAPKKGFFARMSFEWANTAFGSQGSPCPVGYTRFQMRADQFVPIASFASLYMSFRTGIARNLISDQEATAGCSIAVPLIKQFTLGGAGSLRGYQLQEVNKQDLAISGTLSFINYRTQLDLTLAGPLKIGPFLDAGNLFVDRYGFAPLLFSTGLGIRYVTPVGPINLDWGFKLNPATGSEDRHRIHFSVGVL